jgi:hypothetical protein
LGKNIEPALTHLRALARARLLQTSIADDHLGERRRFQLVQKWRGSNTISHIYSVSCLRKPTSARAGARTDVRAHVHPLLQRLDGLIPDIHIFETTEGIFYVARAAIHEPPPSLFFFLLQDGGVACRFPGMLTLVRGPRRRSAPSETLALLGPRPHVR